MLDNSSPQCGMILLKPFKAYLQIYPLNCPHVNIHLRRVNESFCAQHNGGTFSCTGPQHTPLTAPDTGPSDHTQAPAPAPRSKSSSCTYQALLYNNTKNITKTLCFSYGHILIFKPPPRNSVPKGPLLKTWIFTASGNRTALILPAKAKKTPAGCNMQLSSAFVIMKQFTYGSKLQAVNERRWEKCKSSPRFQLQTQWQAPVRIQPRSLLTSAGYPWALGIAKTKSTGLRRLRLCPMICSQSSGCHLQQNWGNFTCCFLKQTLKDYVSNFHVQ